MSSFCTAKATHIFSAKNIRILHIESARKVNEMTLNELIKLTTLWTTGPWFINGPLIEKLRMKWTWRDVTDSGTKWTPMIHGSKAVHVHNTFDAASMCLKCLIVLRIYGWYIFIDTYLHYVQQTYNRHMIFFSAVIIAIPEHLIKFLSKKLTKSKTY